MSLSQVDKQELKELIREVVREELYRMHTEVGELSDPAPQSDIEQLAAQVFDRYDDVFKALA